jgi:hypothetical protein
MADRVQMKGFNSMKDAREWAQRNISGKESHSRASGETKGTYRIMRSGGEGKYASFYVSYDRKDEKKVKRKSAYQKLKTRVRSTPGIGALTRIGLTRGTGSGTGSRK